MAETLRELVVALSLDSSNFSRNMRSINQQIKEAESTFRLAGAGVENFEKTVAGTEAKLSMLGNKLTQQNRAVEQYSRALVAANDKLKENYDRHKDYSARLEQAKARQEALRFEVETSKAAYEHYRDTLGETDSATIAAKANLERYQEEHAEATAEVTKLEGQVKALQKTMQNSADAASKAATDLNNAKAAARETDAEIKKLTEELYRMKSAWTQAGTTLTNFSKKCGTLSKALTKAGKTLTTTVTTPIVGLGTTAVKASMDFESSFAYVRKTVNGTEEDFNKLADASKRMSTEIATSTDEINAVMATGGQLGIATEHIEEFARVMIDLSNASTDLDADTAATQLAKFANIMGTSQSQFSNIGSTIAMLGNNFATTEAPIAEMAMRIAGAGRQIGLTEAQVLGLATALSSVGIQAQAGGSSISKALIKMEVAATTGGDALKDFARVSGMTEQEFVNAWKSDPIKVFQRFIESLAEMNEEGMSSVAVLDEIGISEIRLRDTMLRAVNATELFANAQDMAAEAWEENTALAQKSSVIYGTTASKLKNLKNTALMFAQRIGDDLNPTIQQIIESVNGLLEKFLSLDESQRQSIVKWAAFAAAIGPAVLILGKVVGAVGKVSGALGTAFTAIGKFSAKVSMAGGGLGGLLKTLVSSKLAMVALAAAVVYGAIKLVDYASGAKAAREALDGMAKTAKSWKETEADTFYSRSKGLSFFGMTKDDFVRTTASAKEWLSGLTNVWSDGQKETNEIVESWTESFKSLTATTRDSLQEMKDTADAAGYTSVSDQLQADIKTLDAMDKEITTLLKKRKNRKLTEKDKLRLQELIDTREAIEVKYKLTAADTEGFTTIRKKVEAEIARAEARGQEVSGEVYQEAMVAAAEGMASVNSALDTQYDKEYAVIQLIEDATERQAALDALNAKYNEDRRAAALEYAQLMADMVNPVWQQDNVQEAKGQIGELMQLLRQYSTAKTDSEKKAFLPELNKLTASMDEGALTEYVSLLTQIQSLLDSGISEEEVQAMFPDIDFTTALDQLAAIQQFLKDNKWDTNLTSLNEMFGEAVGDEVLKITTDLDMTGAKARWEEWASNPGAITTDAIIAGYSEAENAEKQQPIVEAFVSKYTEIPEGANTAQLTPEGILAYVTKYAESTTGVDISGLNPTNVTGIVSAYKELASGTDVSQLKPSEITAYVFKYLEENEVDTTGLTPDSVTATVMAYEEITGGASTAALKPSDIVGLIVKYAEAENVDLSALNSAQVEGIVTKFSEVTGCDKSELMKEFVAYITEYKEANGVKKPTLNMQVGLTGYDMLAYRQWLKNNKVEVEGIVRLSEAYEDPTGALHDPGVKFWKDGQEIPVSAVTEDMLKPEDVAVLDKDGTMHVLITAEVTGAPEAIAEMREQVAEVDQLSVTAFGTAMTGIMPASLLDFIKSAEQRIKNAKGDLDQWYNFIYGGNEGILRTLDQSMQSDFNADRMAQLSTYVAEVVAAIKNGEEVSQEDIDNLNKILQFVQDLDSVGVGGNVTAGIAEGMTEAGWDTTAETVAENLEEAINSAFIIESPSKRMEPTGEYVAAGIGEGMAGYDFTTDVTSMVTALQTAISAALPGSLKSVGVNAMAGLKEGINAGRFSVITALRSAVQAAVTAAKQALKIASPSKVFRDEIGSMTMKGFGEGILEESKVQAKIVKNAARYLTGEAQEGAIAFGSMDNRKTYNNTSSVNLTGNNFYVRDEQDIRSLAVEIATLTRRQQRGRGLRMA